MYEYGCFVVGDYIEICEYQRVMDVETMSEKDLRNYYEDLSEKYKSIVIGMINDLTNEQEFFGYNFLQVQRWLKEDEENIVCLRNIWNQVISNYNNIGISSKYTKTIEEIEKIIDKKKKQITIESDDFAMSIINAFCDYCMISKELLFNGEGEIYFVDENYMQEEVISELITKNANIDIEEMWNTKIFFEKIQELLWKENPKHEYIIKTKYAKIKKNGAYQILQNKKSYTKSLIAVHNLIKRLYDLENNFIYPCYIKR